MLTGNNSKFWNIAIIIKMWHKNTKWATAIGKMAPIDLLDPELPQTLNLQEKKKNALLWSTVKQNMIK